MNKGFSKILTIILLSLLAYNVKAQMIQADPNARIKALFIYQFTKYVEWPAGSKGGEFVIGVVGNSSVVSVLEQMATTKKVGAQPIVVKKFSSASQVSGCQMLYLCSDKSSDFTAVLSKLKGKSTLLITEASGLAKKGSVINFVLQDNRQKFELSKNNASKFGLSVSSSLTQLAISVD